MRFKEVVSRDNPTIKQYVQLAASRRQRYAQRCFVTESFKLTMEAFDAGCEPVRLFLTQQALERYGQLAQLLPKAGELLQITPQVAEKLARADSTQGVFAQFRMLDNQSQRVTINENGHFLLLCSLQDPGNLGTILRTAAAFGIHGVLLSSDCPDLYSLKVLRAAMGGVFKIPWEVTEDLCSSIERMKAQGLAVYGAALADTAVPVQQLPLQNGCAVAIGNEGNGLSHEVLACCTAPAIIPMQAGSESLNAAMAAGIFIWEMARH